jgi:phage-related protein
MNTLLKPLLWIGRSREDLRTFPDEARRNIGYALQFAQAGTKHPAAKPLKGFGNARILEIVEDFDSDTFRAVYAVCFAEAVYVLHVFKKKSKSGIRTPKKDIDLIHNRLRRAEEEHRVFKRRQEERRP